MSIKTKIAAAAIAALSNHGGAIGFGIAAGLIAGAAIANNAYAQPAYVVDYGPRRCGWVRQFDGYGNYIGRVRSCAY